MKKIIGLTALAGLLWALFSYHFILFDTKLRILRKTSYTLDNTFVDARGAKRMRLILNPELARAGVQDLLKEVAK